MKALRNSILAAVALPFGSCVTQLHDEQLTPAPRPPMAFTYLGGPQPHLRTWADFYFYPNSLLELRGYDGHWRGHGAIMGQNTTVTLNEGSVIENTTAHPQFYEIQFMLPEHLEAGHVIPLRTVASRRKITRHDSDGDDYSRAEVGELAVSGMSGYAIPMVQPRHSQNVGTVTVESLSPNSMTLNLSATIPLRLDEPHETHYRLQVHRTYVVKRKAPKGRS